MTVEEQLASTAIFDLPFRWLQPSATQKAISQSTQPDPQNDNMNDVVQASRKNLLPAACQSKDNYTFSVPKWNIDWFSEQFDLHRLEDIESYLWLAGRPTPPRPLLYQKAAGRELLVTHQMDMHLLWESKSLYLRPIPSYLFSKMFWGEIIHTDHTDCYPATNKIMEKEKTQQRMSSRADDGHCKCCKLHMAAMGFLYSYIALIPENVDFDIARKAGLTPPEMSWDEWRLFVSKFLQKNPDNLVNVHRRFFHGELRLSRLNKIYKFTLRNRRGYRYKYREYRDFTSRYLGSITVFTGYVVVALSAMQVGLSNNLLQGYDSFQHATYVFTVFSILGPLALLVLVVMAIMFLILANVIHSQSFLRERRAEWDKQNKISA